jgi:hypothetical protein
MHGKAYIQTFAISRDLMFHEILSVVCSWHADIQTFTIFRDLVCREILKVFMHGMAYI